MAYPNNYPATYLQGMDGQPDPTNPVTPAAVASAAGTPVLKRQPGATGMIPAPPAPIVAAPSFGNVVGSASTNVLQPPARMAAGLGDPSTPQVASPALGTQVGQALNTAAHASANFQVGAVNRASAVGADILNTGSAPLRYAGGFVRDVGNAMVGNAPSPNAGQPFSPTVAPQLQMPYRDPTVQFNTNQLPPAPAPDFSGVQGSAATARVQGSAAPLAPGMIPSVPAPIAAAAGATSSGAGNNSAAANTNGAINAQGKRLPYGAMVNGVATFSDGSSGIPGVAGSIPRTMDNATIAGLGGQLNTVPSAAFTNGVLSSDATGTTPSSAGNVAQLVRNAQQPITGSRPSAQDFADADRLAIASQDPRSAAGMAAHNLSMEAQYGGTTRLRRSAEQSLASLTQGAQQSGLQAQQGQQQDAVIGLQGRNELANTALAGQNSLANTGLEVQKAQLTREPQAVTLADGTLATRNPITGVVSPSKLSDGTTAKTLVAKDDAQGKRSNEILDNISKTATELSKSALPPPGAPANWTPDAGQLREQAARMNGLQLGTDPKTGKRFAMVNGQAVAL